LNKGEGSAADVPTMRSSNALNFSTCSLPQLAFHLFSILQTIWRYVSRARCPSGVSTNISTLLLCDSFSMTPKRHSSTQRSARTTASFDTPDTRERSRTRTPLSRASRRRFALIASESLESRSNSTAKANGSFERNAESVLCRKQRFSQLRVSSATSEQGVCCVIHIQVTGR
jgi:hypothetical protein